MFLILAVAVPAGCTLMRSQVVASGAPTAHRLHAPPFLISTDFQVSDRDRLVHELAALREQVQRTLRLPVPERWIEIYIFDDRPKYERFIASQYPELPRRRAFFIAQADREVVYTFRDSRLGEDLRHEAAHALLHAATSHVPLWLDEGLAEFFESPAATDGLHARHLADCKAAIRQGWRPDLTRLEQLTQVSQMKRDDYRDAWAWVYFLLHGSPDGRNLLLQYLAESRGGAPAEPFSSQLSQSTPHPDTELIRLLARLEP